MIKTLNPNYPNPAKTAEIMSRYRPIAPKPETSSGSINDGCSSLSQKIKQSPYLRNLWPQLQARPTRTRKRGRAPITLPSSSLKRQKTQILGFCPMTSSPAKKLSLHSLNFPPLPQLPHLPLPNLIEKSPFSVATNQSLVTLPLLPCSPNSAPKITKAEEFPNVIDLNATVDNNNFNIPEERDLLQLLQKPVPNNVIAPQPVRPIGSCIRVVCISNDSDSNPNSNATTAMARAVKKPEELESEVEAEVLPAVISDSNNRVRVANSAYKEMVGQPECPWLEAMVTGSEAQVQCPTSCRRICGEVTLHLCDSSIPVTANGFSCWVRIEWETERKKSTVNAFCDVIKLACDSRDYLFTWRFHTRIGEASQSSCNYSKFN